ncbi:NAD-dependent malic enzyme [Candidatus Woesearchaeota archaeon]|nr:NAD-dependent malic enzyme [Candidatus Woesearchaeota archaeon]
MDYYKESLKLHEQKKGKIAISLKVPLKTRDDLSLAYTPGVAEPCREIAKNKENAYKYTFKGNTVAVISDGSAVLGLGNIGAEASLPVMEGKAALFREFADIDAFPICLASQEVQKTIETIKNISPVFGGINLEDFKAPECFAIETALQDLGIPVMHDDQHGTAVVVLAGLINALKVVNKKISNVKIVFSGAGAAGTAIFKLLLSYGARSENILICDTKGIIYLGREDIGDSVKKELAQLSNIKRKKGSLADALKEADIFIGVSKKDVVNEIMVKNMAKDAIIFAMANPDPEILPNIAKTAGAAVVATGRSDFPNQVNNALAFPGIFRGALDCRATRITEKMKIAAAEALAGMIKKPNAELIIPSVLDRKVVGVVADAVMDACGKEKL